MQDFQSRDICEGCIEHYYHRWSTNPLCQQHEFLEVPLEPFDEEFARHPHQVTGKIRSWVLNLKEKIITEKPPFDFKRHSIPVDLKSEG